MKSFIAGTGKCRSLVAYVSITLSAAVVAAVVVLGCVHRIVFWFRITSTITRAIQKLNIGHVFASGAKSKRGGSCESATTAEGGDGQANAHNKNDAGHDDNDDDGDLSSIEITDDSGEEHYDDEGYTAYERRQIRLAKRRASRARKLQRRLTVRRGTNSMCRRDEGVGSERLMGVCGDLDDVLLGEAVIVQCLW